MAGHGTPRRGRRGHLAALLVLGAVYLVSRLWAARAGVDFDLLPLSESWQLLDVELLRHNLLSSAFYMPGQPPLYNLAVGGLLKLGDTAGLDAPDVADLFRLAYGGLAIIAIGLFYCLLCAIDLGPTMACAVAGVFALSPAFLLYENEPYYTLLVLVGLLLSALCFLRCLARPGFSRASLLFFCLAGLIYTRSLFQVEWLIVLVVLTLLCCPGHRRRIGLAAALPLLLVLALYAKNDRVIGQFATSDWLGLSLAKLTTLQLSHAERARLVADDRLSRFALDDRSFELSDDEIRALGGAAHTGVAVLDRRYKSTGAPNFNNRLFAELSRRAREDALHVMFMRPELYLGAIRQAWLMSWRPSGDYPLLEDNRAHIAGYNRWYAHVLAGQIHVPEHPGFALKPGRIGLFIALVDLIAMSYGMLLVRRLRTGPGARPIDGLLLFCWLNLMYVSVVGNAFEIDENQRFRFAVDPFIVMLAIAALREMLAGLYTYRRARGSARR